MENLKKKLSTTNWQSVTESMNEKGYAIIPKIITEEQCEELVQQYNTENLY